MNCAKKTGDKTLDKVLNILYNLNLTIWRRMKKIVKTKVFRVSMYVLIALLGMTMFCVWNIQT